MDIKKVLTEHVMWLRGEVGSRADLSRADLYGADLSGANLYGADLSRADLSGADLYGADLSRADLSGANLYGADLSRANLYGANLYGANLSGANLSGANLSRANLSDYQKATLLIVPQDGDVTGWKKCRDGVLVKLRIPHNVPRHNATGRKCRAERARVIDVIGAEKGVSIYNPSFVYIPGQMVVAVNYDHDRFNECGGGIHFFITREEAEAFNG